MKKVVLAAALAVGSFVPALAFAATDVFGTSQELDGSYSLRRTTTEQFDPIRGQSVLTRPRPDFDPVPITFSSFNIYPSLDAGIEYNDNIFAQQKFHTSDTPLSLYPGINAQSNWGRHALAITAGGNISYYPWNNQQNFNNATVQMEGRYDIAERTWADFTTGYQRVTELRGNPSTPASQAGPSQYNLYSGSAVVNRSVGVIQAKGFYDTAYYQYAPFDLIGGGTFDQSARNRVQNDLGGEVSYNAVENLKPYAGVTYNWHDYVNSGARNSNGYKADVGARMDFGGVTTAQAYIGYMQQDYFNFVHNNVNAIDYGADVLWNVTTLTSVEGKAARSIEESTSGLAPAYINNMGKVTVSHELMRNTILQAGVTYNGLEYEGITQHDDFYNVMGAARYYFNRNLHTDLTYNYERKESSVAGNDFDQHSIMLRVGFQY